MVNCYSQHPWDYFKTIHTSILNIKERSQSDSFRDSIEAFNILSSTDFLNANQNEQIFFLICDNRTPNKTSKQLLKSSNQHITSTTPIAII